MTIYPCLMDQYSLDYYDYMLDERLIAHAPAGQRDQSRMLVLDRVTGQMEHRIFADISSYLQAGDVLVRNNTRVFPARLLGRKTTGASVELLLLRCLGDKDWEAMARPGKRLKPGDAVAFSPDLQARILDTLPDGNKVVRFNCSGDLLPIIDRVGEVPLPPYIDKNKSGLSDENIKARYQTVYAQDSGSSAAPTAGMHFTPQLFAQLAEKGIDVLDVTLHVGPGTFKPVQTEDIRKHQMHQEFFTVTSTTAKKLREAKDDGRRIIAVGTTSVRVLEAQAGNIMAGKQNIEGQTDIFIWPGYQFKLVNAMITNFHLPKSTLLMLICAFAGRDQVIRAYDQAQQMGYRFFSFGDAMLII